MNRVCWKLHCQTPPERLFTYWSTNAGRKQFWAEYSVDQPGGFSLTFPDGTVEHCTLLSSEAPRRFTFSYFDSTVVVELVSDGSGGTDLTLTNSGIPDAEVDEVRAGWLSVLLPLKASADFGVDLRNHDPARTWREHYVDQ